MKLKLVFFVGCFFLMQSQFAYSQASVEKTIAENKTENMDEYDITYYKLDLGLNFTYRMIVGCASIKIKALSNIDKVELHLEDSMKIDSVKIESEKADYIHENDLLTISLNKSVEKDKTVSIDIYYRGTPNSAHFLFGYLGDKQIVCTYNLPFGARTWFPCKDLPSDKADSMDILLTVPEQMTAVSCGKLIEEKLLDNGSKRFWWHEKYPIATFSVGICAYAYQIKKGFVVISGDTLEVDFYYWEKHLARIYEIFEKAKEMLVYYSETLGTYPFRGEKFAIVESIFGKQDVGHNFMSHQTYTAIAMDYGNDMYFDDAMMGQWFGQMVSCQNFHHLWLMTGMIEWGRYFWYEWFYGHGRETSLQEATLQEFKEGTVYVEDVSDEAQYNWKLITSKASWVIHMLRYVVGDGPFFRSLRTICNDSEYRYSSITTEQFQEAVEQVSGKKLDWFFQQWIYEIGFPEFELRYKIVQKASNLYEIDGAIRQVQSIGPIFKTPIEMSIKSLSGDSTFTFWIDEKEEYFHFNYTKNPKSMALNENKNIVCKVYTVDKSELIFQNYQLFDFIGNHDQNLDAGETVRLTFSVKNKGVRIVKPKIKISSPSPEIKLIDSEFEVEDIEYDSIFSTVKTPFTFSINQQVENCFIQLQLSVTENSTIILSKEIFLSVGKSDLLLMDNDLGGYVEAEFRHIFWKAQKYYQYWETKDHFFPDSLTKYKAIIWFSGEAKNNLLSQANKDRLIAYLQQGGNLLVSSQNLAYDLSTNGSVADSLFLANYLGVTFIGDVITDSLSVGLRGDPVADRQYAYFYGKYGLRNQQSRDQIEAVSPSASILTYYPSQRSAGVRLSLDAYNAKVVYLAFGLEGVGGPRSYSADSLLSRAIKWFDSPTSAIYNDLPNQTTNFKIINNYPNPFNASTTIRFLIDRPSKISLKVFNSLGQEIAVLSEKDFPSGEFSVAWEGRNHRGQQVSSGLYFARLESQEKSSIVKMLLIR